MSALRTWFDGRSLRERRLILVMLALLAITLAWLLVIMPVRDALSASRTRYTDAVVRLGQVEASTRAVKAIQRAQPAPVPLPIADAIRARTSAAGLSLMTLEPQGNDQVHIAVAGARAGALTAWFAQLESEGLLIDRAKLTPAGGGSVDADATITARQP